MEHSNGLTTVAPTDLKRQIAIGRASACDTSAQEARPKSSKRLPQTVEPAPAPAPHMGNKPSSLHGSSMPAEDDSSVSSVVHNPMRVWRKSSTNLLKRFDGKSPLPRPLTATSIIVATISPGQESPESPVDPFIDPAHAARESVIMLPSPSSRPTTAVDEVEDQTLSRSTTIREARRQKSYTDFGMVSASESDEGAAVPVHDRSAMSPTIPAPSPMPEDSPHKYGLKDHAGTPEKVFEPPEELNVQKARRRSSGLEIFNVSPYLSSALPAVTDTSSQEAKCLQSASSFLNGLSTSRRRAESQNRTTDTWHTNFSATNLHTSGGLSRPHSRLTLSRPPSTRPPSAAYLSGASITDLHGRRAGKNFKSSGVAYSLPLDVVQLKCYQNHATLHPSRNKHAPVECAVCHLDDVQDHFACGWCALRMCRYCREDFDRRGGVALKERVRKAEMVGSPGSSSESLSLSVSGGGGGGGGGGGADGADGVRGRSRGYR
ncbi:hypothetical protein LTR62_005345 [Meristemomyces frigidus]|uniref:Uncharacterized protein n=1 Tax=Meristemomyces frigidus TaxID=1508187 RepID=A0AAN7TPX1_9PEZI|nr:hypothetical protein LTR62_005345 [Meristemomyces frigidus]